MIKLFLITLLCVAVFAQSVPGNNVGQNWQGSMNGFNDMFRLMDQNNLMQQPMESPQTTTTTTTTPATTTATYWFRGQGR